MKGHFVVPVLAALLLSGCVTMSGNYVVTAEGSDGAAVASQLAITAQGSGIYTARNAFCSNYPGATVHIKDAVTGEELKGESPYKCR